MNLVVPAGLKLLPFQEEAAHQMLAFLKQYYGVYNACEMRLGKTIQTAVVLNTLVYELNHAPRILIISPAIVRNVWATELQKWQLFNALIAVIPASSAFNLAGVADIIITSYELATSNIDILCKYNWDFLILDEAHALKSSKAKRTKAILGKLWDKCKYKIALSGTPFLSDVQDGYTLFHKFAPDVFTDWWKFCTRYCLRKPDPFSPTGFKFYGIKNHEELRQIIRSKFFVRYTQEEVRDQLPEKTYQKVILSNKTKLKNLNPEIEAELKLIEENIEKGVPIKVPPHIASHRKAQGLLKVQEIADYCRMFLDVEIPVVVFVIHKEVGERLKEELKKYKPVLINGETSNKDRETGISSFNSGHTDCFIGNVQAAGVGISLSRANECILGEVDWSPSIINQSIERLVRLGKKSAIRISYLIAPDSIDQKIMEVVINKTRTFEKVLAA